MILENSCPELSLSLETCPFNRGQAKMEENPEKSEKISDNLDKTFNFVDICAGVHQPLYPFFFSLMRKKLINSHEFTVYQAIFHEAFFLKSGLLQFKLSNKDIQEKTGLSKYLVAASLVKLERLRLIKVPPVRNGLPAKIKLNLVALRKYNKKYQSNHLPGTSQTSSQVPGKPFSDLSNGLTGTSQTISPHLLSKVLKVSLLHENKFFEHSRRSLFKADLIRLVQEGVDIDAVASFLKTCDFAQMKSFYAVISSKRASIEQAHREIQNLKDKNEDASRIQNTPEIQSRIDEVQFKTPECMGKPRNWKDAFKVKSEGKNLLQRVEYSNFLDDVHNL
jgi:DNA-binding transcriptional regulator GbsR (MarR family)